MIAALPGVQTNVMVTFELFQPAALGAGETETVIDGGPGDVTVRVVENENGFNEAVIVDVPAVAAVAKPFPPTVATPGVEDTHVTVPVMSRVVPSEYLPATANCWVAPDGTNGFCGLTIALSNAGPMTESVVEAVTFPEVAVIVVVPWATEVTSPTGLTVATDADIEFQVAALVRSCVLPSAYVPIAFSDCIRPKGMDGLCGLMAMESNWVVTVSVAKALNPLELAVIVATP